MTQTAESKTNFLKLPQQFPALSELQQLLKFTNNPPKLPIRLEDYRSVRHIDADYADLITKIKLYIMVLLAVPADTTTYEQLQLLFTFFENICTTETYYDACLNAIRFDVLNAISRGETVVTVPIYAFTVFNFPNNFNNNTVAYSYSEEIARELQTKPGFLFPGLHILNVKKVINPNEQLATDAKWLLQISFKQVPLNGD